MTDLTPQTPAEEPKAGISKRFLIIGVAAGLVIAMVGAGAFAWSKLSGGGTQPHDVLPSSVIAYARVDADPSASQKIAILRLIRKFPDLAKELGIKDVDQDIRKPLLEDLLGGCDLDYEDDAEPWLGNRIGVAYDADIETPVVAVQVSDEGKARTGINKLADCGGPDAGTGIAFLDGYALVTPKKADAAKVRDAAAKKPLAGNTAYAKDVEELGEQGVFSAWADLEEVGSIDELQAFGAGIEDAFAGASTVALTLRASSSSLEIASITHLDKAPESTEATNLANLPDDTALAFSVSGLGEDFSAESEDLFKEGFMAGFSGGAVDPQQELDDFGNEFGLKLPEDLETLLGDGLMFAIGSRNLETIPLLSGPDDVTKLDIGLKLTTDPTKGADLAQRLVDLAAKAGIVLAATPTDDGVVIATNTDAAEALTGDGDLGKSDNFKQAVAHKGSLPAFYLNMDAVLEALKNSNPPPDIEDVLDELEPLSALAFSSEYDDKLFKATLRLTLD